MSQIIYPQKPNVIQKWSKIDGAFEYQMNWWYPIMRIISACQPHNPILNAIEIYVMQNELDVITF